jgi:hypothetical protein
MSNCVKQSQGLKARADVRRLILYPRESDSCKYAEFAESFFPKKMSLVTSAATNIGFIVFLSHAIQNLVAADVRRL